MDNLTLAELEQTITDLTVVYYGTFDTCPKGECYQVWEGRWNPAFIIVHPDDLESLREIVKPKQLVHLSEEPLEGARQRLIKNLYQPKLEDTYPHYSYFRYRYTW